MFVRNNFSKLKQQFLTTACALLHDRHMPQTLLPSATVCERLLIDRSTLSRWVAAGRITPSLRLPGLTGAMLFDPKDVERLERELKAAS